MPRVVYNRPISKVGFRIMDQTRPGYAAALSGIGTLGDDAATLTNCGYSDAQVAEIISAHNSGALSDQGFNALLAATPFGGCGQMFDESQLAAFLENDPGFPSASTPGGSAGAPTGVPTGSIVVYQGTWVTSTQAGAWGSGAGTQDVVSKVSSLLAGVGLSVQSANIIGQADIPTRILATDWPFTVSLTLQVTDAGHAQASDVAQLVNHAVYQVTGNMPTQSSAALAGVGGGGLPSSQVGQPGGAGPPSPPGSIGAFLEQNMTTLLFALGAIVLLPAVVKKL